VIVAVSGGVDSAVCLALAARSLGPAKVHGLLLPESESAATTTPLGRLVAEHVGVAYDTETIAPTLDAIGCYRKRDDSIRTIFPDYGAGWRNKLVLDNSQQGQLNFFKLVVESPGGERFEKRLPHKQFLEIVAAQNYKQRIRKTVEYFHADRLNYAVIGTPNRLEYDQGFFVKNGDGAADIKPIAHLYKSQVYALARFLALPAEVCNAVPTTDTYSLPQGQDEFYFVLPYEKADLALWGLNHGFSTAALAQALAITEEQAAFIYRDLRGRREMARRLHSRPLLVRPVDEVQPL
jgi:NAD+ synthase